MTLYCAKNGDTAVERQIEDLGCGGGRMRCLECNGSGWWNFAAPEVPGFTCNDGKGNGYMLVAIA